MAAVMRAIVSLLLCTLCVFVKGKNSAAYRGITPSDLVLRFASIFAGEYETPEPTGLKLNFKYVPVVVPVLWPAVTFYYEQRVNDSPEPTFKQIYAFKEETPTEIRQSVYDIENAERFSIDQKESLLNLRKLELSELSNRPECDAIWKQIEDELFTSTLATNQCFFNFGGVEVRPDGSRNLTCSNLTLVEVFRDISNDEIIAGSLEPIVLEEISNLYPFPILVYRRNQCFEVPCAGNN